MAFCVCMAAGLGSGACGGTGHRSSEIDYDDAHFSFTRRSRRGRCRVLSLKLALTCRAAAPRSCRCSRENQRSCCAWKARLAAAEQLRARKDAKSARWLAGCPAQSRVAMAQRHEHSSSAASRSRTTAQALGFAKSLFR